MTPFYLEPSFKSHGNEIDSPPFSLGDCPTRPARLFAAAPRGIVREIAEICPHLKYKIKHIKTLHFSDICKIYFTAKPLTSAIQNR